MKNFFYSLTLLALLFPFLDDVGHASFVSIKHLRGENETWGDIVSRKNEYEPCVMGGCLQEICPIKERVISPCTGEEIIEFFENQELTSYVPEVIITKKNNRQTFQYGCGVEFPKHGGIEIKTTAYIKELLDLNEGEKVSFMDIGGGYGKFILDVLTGLNCETENLDIYFNEMSSTQCYQAASSFKGLLEYENIKFYPRNILGLLASDYGGYSIGETFNITTCLNVYHFSGGLNGVEDSLRAVYDITNSGGIHIAVSLSPYHEGESFFIAQAYEERIKEGREETYDYFFSADEYGRSNSFLTPERYESLFREVGFTVSESGYFSDEENYPRKFSYIIGQKPE